MAELKVCDLCNRLRVPPTRHRISESEARALGAQRCRMCGKAATVRCVLGDDDFWVECGSRHLSRTH